MRLLTQTVLFCVVPSCFGAASPDTLQQILARMDTSAGTFQGMTASITQTDHNAILSEDNQQSGTVKMKRVRGHVVGLIDIVKPDPMTVALREGEVQKLLPKIATVEVYDVRKYGEQLDDFLLLGFGTSGKDLQRNFTVKLVGPQTLNGRNVTVLDLFPLSKDAKEMMEKVQLWVLDGETYPLQEKIFQKGGDFKLIMYNDVKLTGSLTDKDVELKLPPGVKKIYPQKSN